MNYLRKPHYVLPCVQTSPCNEVRELLRPSEVKSGVPNWFRLGFLRTFPGVSRGTSWWEVADALRNRFKVTWLDHWGQCSWGNGMAFCSEPYSIGVEGLQSVQDLATAIGCEWSLSANSFHYPGWTIRIVFFQKSEGSKS